ncbi:response regulator [Dethiosulfatarculus sandiegensis]|uniref:histidine kinase n=1 Tax=Dethiosulfatarculus sandiegensis TaxID=1429043 RepID=A0A0D2GM61_9BACT|nr:response regulator [Dethiosulfatarculus sandiegensis]KIX15797.1 histidine kinase [Dethiosulfatarculus sandiegensis]
MSLERRNILLVDDELDFLKTLGKRLMLRGFSVLTATSGEKALEILKDRQVDLVVLDVKMPGMDGISTLKMIKKLEPALEVIMLTGHADLEASLEGVKLGFFDYLTKPVDIERLVKKIKNALTDASAQSETDPSVFSNKLKQSMILADRLASLGTLAAGVAHELNNPLAIISEANGWLKSKVAREQGLDDSLRQAFEMALEKIEKSLERANRITLGLLNFARKTDSQIQEVDLGELGKEVFELTRKAADKAQAETRVEVFSANPLAKVDPFPLRQVLLDLVTNALQAIDFNGRVQIAIKDSGPNVALEVTDNGSGIQPRDLERIFEPFFTTKPPELGTGLGLSVSRSLVEKLGGDLQVESELGKGSLFRVVLPRTPQPESLDPK